MMPAAEHSVHGSPHDGPHDDVHALRAAIEQVDDQIVAALARRMALARAMAHAKQQVGQSILDPAREVAVVSRAARTARHLGLPDRDIRGLFWSILAMSRRAQLEVNARREPSDHDEYP